ncbi:hypothetical protein [Streptomyces solicathayae]|uniref:Uncharacterized protein n=1 Tax=Streptomyces solicathayae TaxID=3081768 RepID=A0ABZ0LMF6_9ACTN|nr:hypothetical protein [Streptomyces sp. HUAS YS2]WOX20680.1 hypothetical protein R2D22_04450 [Streptomyces sp. HUAS YS2]
MAAVTGDGASFSDAFSGAFDEAFPGHGTHSGPVLIPEPAADPAVIDLADRQTLRLAECLIAEAPSDCRRITAVFALTLRSEASRVRHSTDRASTNAAPSPGALRLARELRRTTARLPRGPWWRMTLDLRIDGGIEVDFDHGDEPFPDEHLFAPEDYRADLEAFDWPAEKLPTWLSAFVSHGGRQMRSPRKAAVPADTRGARSAQGVPENELSGLTEIWARWAVLSAAFVAAGSERGPRMQPSHARFQSSTGGGSTLWMLAGGRAVLSGGVRDAPGLADAYRGDAPHPELFAGAPAWVADPLLDERGKVGLMSFCYWWESGRWLRGESPKMEELATAMPGVWTSGTVAGIVSELARAVARDTETAALRLVTAAEGGFAERGMLAEVFGNSEGADLDGAYHQLLMAGVVHGTDLPQLPRHQAIALVRRYMHAHDLDSPDYRAADLVAQRVDCGWQVYAPVPAGEIRIGRGLFFVADDEVMEITDTQSSYPHLYAEEFARRYRERWGL